MSTSRDPDMLIRAFIEEGIEELPDSSYDVVRSSIDNTRQRVVIGPWRIEQVTKFATYGIAAAAVVLIAVVGIRLLPSNDGALGPGATSTPTLTPAPTQEPTPPSEPTDAPASGLTLSEEYASALNGMTVSYPAGWTVRRPASAPWTEGWLTLDHTGADIIHAPGDSSAFIALASQPLGDKTAEQWIEDFAAMGPICGPPISYPIAGVAGVITYCDDGPHAVVVRDGRAHVVWLYEADFLPYFYQILETLQLT